MASGTSAARVSRIGLPLSRVSARASSSRFSSILSAIFSRMPARSAGEVRAQRSFTACAASSAFSMSSAEERAISQIGSPLMGLWSVKYRPFSGATHVPPIKFSYFDLTPPLRSVSTACWTDVCLTESLTAIKISPFSALLIKDDDRQYAAKLPCPTKRIGERMIGADASAHHPSEVNRGGKGSQRVTSA